MNFETIEQVPTPIAEFYETETVWVKTGNKVPKVIDQVDENGDPVQYEIMVDEYESYEKPVLKSFGETKSWGDVERVIEAGKPEAVIDKFIELAENGDKKNFHDTYLLYLEEWDAVQEHNMNLTVDENGVMGSPKEFPAEPTYTATNAQTFRVKLAKKARDDGRHSPITVDGMSFDTDSESYANMLGTITSWDHLMTHPILLEKGAVTGTHIIWTLEDNSNVPVTKETLQKVVNEIHLRAGLLHINYQIAKQ